jgi:hypothetical protein
MNSNFNCSYMAMSSLTYNLELKKFLFLVTAAILKGERSCQTQFWKGPTPAKFGFIWFSGFRGEDLNVKMSSNFNCSYMARSSLTFIPDFSVKFSFSRYIPISSRGLKARWAKNNYLTLTDLKVKVSRRSLRYATRRLMVMHPHTWKRLERHFNFMCR